MKIDLTILIKGLNGKPIENDDKSSMTFADAFKTALLTYIEEDKDISADDKLKNWELAKLIDKNAKGSVELKTEQVVRIKERIHKVFLSPIVYGNVCDVIEKKSND